MQSLYFSFVILFYFSTQTLENLFLTSSALRNHHIRNETSVTRVPKRMGLSWGTPVRSQDGLDFTEGLLLSQVTGQVGGCLCSAPLSPPYLLSSTLSAALPVQSPEGGDCGVHFSPLQPQVRPAQADEGRSGFSPEGGRAWRALARL